MGPVGRESDHVRLRVAPQTASKTLKEHLAQGTRPPAVVNTDEGQGYNHIARQRVPVNHGDHEWARDDEGDGHREVHIHTPQGMWTGVRNFLRSFRGVQKIYLAD